MKKLLLISVAIIISFQCISVSRAMGTDEIASKYSYFKIRHQIACNKYDPTDARCFWNKVELVHAKEILEKTDIIEYLTEAELERITKKIGFLKSRYTNFCTDVNEPAKSCSALGKLIYKGEYFLENKQSFAEYTTSCLSEDGEDYDDLLNNIEQGVYEIDSRTDLKEYIEIIISGDSSEGSEFTICMNEDKTSKIVVYYFGEMGNVSYTYYFVTQGLMYVVINEISYDMPIYIEGHKKISDTKDYFYFKDKKLIKWKSDSEKAVSVCDEELERWESDIIQGFEELISE